MGEISNYMQFKIPVGNSDKVFEALCHSAGISLEPNEDGEVPDKEECAREAVKRYINNCVVENENRLAIEQAQNNREDMGIK